MKVDIVHDPGNTFVIKELFAFCSVDEGGEGIIAAPVPGLGNMPLVGADMDRINSLRPFAQEIADLFGKKIILKKFSNVEVMEELCPKEKSTT